MNTWGEWWLEYSKVKGYHPIEGYMYDAWTAGFEAGALNSEKEIAHLKAQLLRVGNQEKVVKEAFLAGQMARNK
jgi:hypothetical protein